MIQVNLHFTARRYTLFSILPRFFTLFPSNRVLIRNKIVSLWPINVLNDYNMAASVLNKIEYLVLLVAAFASRTNVSEAQAYRYLNQYGALALCDKHYGIMHTLSLEENIETLQAYCQRKGGKL